MVSAVLRFDNYLILFFTQGVAEKPDDISLQLDGTRHTPEYVFWRYGVESPDTIQASAYFWIDDLAYLAQQDLNWVPVYRADNSPLPGYETLGRFDRISDKDFSTWIQKTRESRLLDAFNCRYFPEVFIYASHEDQLALIEAFVEYASTDQICSNIVQMMGETARQRELFYCLFQYLNRKTLSYAEASLQELFCDLAPGGSTSSFAAKEVVSLYELLRELGLNEIAVDKVAAYLSATGWDREVLKDTLPEFLPGESKWALYHTFGNTYLGNEQVAETVMLWVREFRVSRQTNLEELFWRVIIGVCHRRQVGVWLDYGYRLAETGDLASAHEVFKRIDRGYAQYGISGRVPWHLMSGARDADPLSEVRDASDLPRVTIITPTLNQAEYIEQTLQSVAAQAYPNLQYIVVDGGSSDGTLEILERYRPQIDILISERDNGQSHALNKGLVQADGDLIGWLNSDDLLGPGTLAQLANAYLRDDAEVFAGICCEFDGSKIGTVNRPSLGKYGLQVPALADIFGRWFSGEFFNQPEVFFSRDLLERTGLLDEDYTYAMDYDLWMRFAQRGARVCTISWPFAFFRLHDKQKIKSRTATIEEQARIRDGYITWQPGYDQRMSILGRARRYFGPQGGHLHVVSARMPKIFAARYGEELANEIGSPCSFVEKIDPSRVGDGDIVIKLIHLQNDLEEIEAIREKAPDACIVGWFWDNHHHTDANFSVAQALDVVIPGHSAFESYLRNHNALQLPTVPLSTTQWTRAEAAQWSDHIASCKRSPALYGGYVEYGYSDRIDFVKDIQAAMPDNNLYSIEERQLHKYFGMSSEARLNDWAAHMVSLVLPLRQDLSQRVFDALLAGQIPLVPDNLTALDDVFGTDDHYELPIVRFRYGDVESVLQAHARAMELFKSNGKDGIRRRHNAALENHMFGSRISSILDKLRHLDTETAAQRRSHA